MAERSFAREVRSLDLGDGDVFHGEGILAVAKALLQSGVSYVGGYQGAPVSHMMDVFNDARGILDSLGVHVETCANEAAACAMLSASINYPVRGCAVWKSTVGTNVASDALSNLASAGVTGGALIVVGEDYGDGSSIIQERSHAFAMKSQVWLLDSAPEPARDGAGGGEGLRAVGGQRHPGDAGAAHPRLPCTRQLRHPREPRSPPGRAAGSLEGPRFDYGRICLPRHPPTPRNRTRCGRTMAGRGRVHPGATVSTSTFRRRAPAPSTTSGSSPRAGCTTRCSVRWRSSGSRTRRVARGFPSSSSTSPTRSFRRRYRASARASARCWWWRKVSPPTWRKPSGVSCAGPT